MARVPILEILNQIPWLPFWYLQVISKTFHGRFYEILDNFQGHRIVGIGLKKRRKHATFKEDHNRAPIRAADSCKGF